MLLQRSRLAVQQVERPYLAPSWLVILLGGIVAIGLIFIYPHRDLVRRVAEAPDSELSSAYLTNLLRSDPNNPRLRFLLSRHQLGLQQHDLARTTLQLALNDADPTLRREARWLNWQIAEDELEHLPSTAWEKQQTLLESLKTGLAELANENWSEESGLQLANKTYDLSEPKLALQILQRIAAQMPERQQAEEFFEEAARAALGFSRYQASAELYILARQMTDDPRTARQYFHTALRVLQSGNQTASALELGERELGVLADDQETLILLTTLARLERRPDVAERYIRRLLKISLLRQWQALQVARAWGAGFFRPVSTNSKAVEPGIAFDEKIYSLGYEVFLDNRKLEDAWQVAASAVRQKPEDMVWRERLARVSEWSSRPEIALENWLTVAKQTQNDEAWQAVLRLAPGLFNDSALRAGLLYQLGKTPDDWRLLKELVAAYEREGDPRTALSYLGRHIQRRPDPEALVLMADLADRAGQADIAINAWQRLFQNKNEITPARAVRAAVLLMLQGRGDEALHWLDLAQNRLGEDSVTDLQFLRLSGQLAQLQHQDAQAIKTFTKLTGLEKAEVRDFDTLIQLLNETYPIESAKVAARAWERFDQIQHLTQALNLYASQNQWTEMGTLFGKLDAAPDAERRSLLKMRRQLEFLRLAGTYHHNTGNFREARRDFEAGLIIAPGSAAMQQGLLWLYIDSNDAVSLRRLLASREPEWRNDPSLHDALASAYQALSLPQVALERYMTPRVVAHQNDFLWMMNYADALDQNQQTDRAWRLRRHLLSREWQDNVQKANPARPTQLEARQHWLTEAGLENTRRIARTRLLLTQRPGDTGLDALRELLRLDRGAEKNYSNSAAEMAIGWFQDAGEYNAERGFLWHQYGRSKGKPANRPLWAEITIALAEEDRAASGQLLETFGDRLPRYDRINAARAAGDLRLVQTSAFEAQTDQTDDDALHMQLADSLLEFSDHAGMALRSTQLGSMDERTSAGVWHVAVNPRLSLDFHFGQMQRQSKDSNVIVLPPDEIFSSMKINWLHSNGETTLLTEHRDSFASYNPIQVEHEYRIDNRLSLRIGLGSQLTTQESLPLRIAGMKDRAVFSLRYQPTRQDQIIVEHWAERYNLQSGARVGSGQHSSATLSHAYRQEARDLQFSLFWSTHQYSRLDDPSNASDKDRQFLKYTPPGTTLTPSYFLPDDFSFYGIRVSSDVRYEDQYTRATRPFGSISRTWHSILGPGYDLRLGLAGSVLGTDHLSLTWGLGKSGMQSSGLLRDLQLNYRIHY